MASTPCAGMSSPPVEVGQPAAGLLEDGARPGQVPDLQLVLDHGLGGALGHEHVAVEVAQAAVPPDASEQVEEARRQPEARMPATDE